MEPQAPTVVTATTVSSTSGLFGSKIPASAAFIIAILLFLLPFAEIKCSNETVAHQTGIGFVMGSEWKAKGLFDQKDVKKGPGDKPLGNSQIISIVILALAIIGLILILLTSNGGAAAVCGLLAAGGLLYFMIDLKNAFNASIKKDATDQVSQGANEAGLDGLSSAFSDVKASLAFTPVFWILLVVLLAASFFSWQRGRVRMV
jgi:hypothetical protein